MQENFKKSTKNEKQFFQRERERDITLCLQENIQNERDNCKFIVREGEDKAKNRER